MGHLRQLVASLPLLALTPFTSATLSGCVMCDCSEEYLLVSFVEGGEPLSSDAVEVEWAGEVVQAACWPLSWDTAEDGPQLPCDTWYVSLWDVVVPAEGETVVFTLDLPGRKTSSASWVSPGPSGSGCCGRGVWETFELETAP